MIITVAQHKGGTGKTTVAAHLAVAYSIKGKKVALVDTDLQNSLSTWWFVRQQNANHFNSDTKFFKTAGLELIKLLSELKNSFDLIIIDSPPHAYKDNQNTIAVSDFIIVPTQLSPIDLWAMHSIAKFIDEGKKDYRILLNRYNANLKLSKGLKNHLPDKIFESHLSNKTAYSLAMLNGKTVLEVAGAKSAVSEIDSLVNEITKICSI